MFHFSHLENEEGRAVYEDLLRVYMTTPRGADEAFIQQLRSAAFVLLDKHYKEINVPKVVLSFALLMTRLLKFYLKKLLSKIFIRFWRTY